MLAVRSLVKWMARSAETRAGGRSMSSTCRSATTTRHRRTTCSTGRCSELLLAARRRGCAVVCSAGNDATDRPAFPAALWRWRGA